MKAIEGLFQKIEPLQHPERTDARTHGRTHATEIITLPAKAGGNYGTDKLIMRYMSSPLDGRSHYETDGLIIGHMS